MNKRQFNKKLKKDSVSFAYKICLSEEMKEDSIAHLIKSYFTVNEMHCREMFKYDKDKGKLLVSKKALLHILKISGGAFLDNDFDFEFVPEIDVFAKKGDNNG